MNMFTDPVFNSYLLHLEKQGYSKSYFKENMVKLYRSYKKNRRNIIKMLKAKDTKKVKK